MKTIHQILRERLHQKAGLIDNKPKLSKQDVEKLWQQQWSHEFELLMRNRLVMGAMRYGKFSEQKVSALDNIAYAIKKLAEYKMTGNLENLVDGANLCLVEFVNGKHPKRHFHSIDRA